MAAYRAVEVFMGGQTLTESPNEQGNGRGGSAELFVGLGASAGGLEPLQRFFASLPSNPGLAFIVVQHLEPHHPSLLAELLSRHAAMPVVEAVDGMRVEPDHVYVIAPGTLLTVTQAVLHVAATEAAPSSPIDAFFHSLAEDQGDHAVGVLFSGAGHDGTVGLRTIKEHGGLTLAQPPETARHDSMLQSAIGAGLVDHVVPVERMSAKLTEHAEHLAKFDGARGAVELDEQLATRLGQICSLIHQRTGHDFSRYKEGTLLRRIRRRIQVSRVDSIEDYLGLLEKDAAEAEGLLKDLLIGVTQFFRDPDAFQALAQQIIHRIVQGKATDAPIRIWVPGCASGEEAYSIAILLREHLERLETRRFVQIFATDLDAEMLAEARHGRYPTDIAEHVSPKRLARFFVREGQTYQAVKELREMCIFSEHSLIRDPPFSQLDLVSCRNVLIYLSAELQKKLVPLFHYALRPGGFLFLGPSEGIAGSPELFEPTDKRNRVFRRKETVTRPMVEFPLSGRRAMRASPGSTTAPTSSEPTAPTAQEKISVAFERVLRDDYTCPSAVINERGDVLFIAGPISRYLQLSAGAMTMPNLLESFRGGLRHELRLALRTARSGGRKVVRNDIQVEVEDAARKVRLVVRPMPAIDPEVGLFLVVVQEGFPDEVTGEVEVAASQPAVEQLEDELRTTRAELKTTVEELESANEELKSSNEELISTNEELQSANEEMQTSKEELQSLNEELETVNTELRQKVDELGAANSDLQNLFAATEIATIFLDRSLRVAKFTPAATALFHLIETDVGRPLADFAQRFAGQNLVSDAQEVLRLLMPIERQVRTAEGAWFVLRVVPYRTVENLIAGVVVTFVDVTELKRAEEEVRRQSQLVHLSHDAILIWPLEGGIESWNRGAQELYGFSREEALGRVSQQLLQSTFPCPWPEIEAELLAGGCWAGDIQQRTKEGRTIIVSGNFQLVRGDDGVARVLEANRDITKRRRAEEEQRRLAAELADRVGELQAILDHAPIAIWIAHDPECRKITGNAFADQVIMRTGAGANISRSVPADETPVSYRVLRNGVELGPEELPAQVAATSGKNVPGEEVELVFSDGRRVHMILGAAPLFDAEGRPRGSITAGAEITRLKQAEAAVLESHGRTTAILESIADAFYSLDAEWRFVVVNPAAERAPFGRPASELLGKVIWDVFPSIPGTRIHQHYLDAVEKRSREHYEAQSPLNGRWYEVFMFPREGGLDVYMRDIDERKQAEMALKESEERFRTLASNAQDSIARFDRGGRYVYVNPFVTRLLGIPEEAILGKTVEELGRNVGTENFEERLREVLDSDQPLRFDRRSTEGRWFDVQLIPESRDGTVETVLAFSRDVTERKAVEAALRDSEESLKLAQQIAHIGSWELDLVENRVSWSDEVYRIFGLEPQAFGATYEAFLDAVHPEDRGAVDAAYSGSLREGRDSYEIEHRVVRKASGEIRIVHEKCEHVRDASGRIIRSVGMVQDITERQCVESENQNLLASVRQEKERLSALVGSISDEIWFCDTHRQFTLANAPALKEFRISSEAAVNVEALATSLEVLRPDGSPRPVEDAPPLRALAGEMLRNQEEIIRTPASGELRYREVSAAPVKNGTGQIIGSVSVVRDITERKQAGREVEAQRNLLETIVNQLPVGVNLVRGSDLAYKLVNGAYRAIAPGKIMLGKSVQEVWPEVHPRLSEIYRRVLDTGDPHLSADELIPIARSPGGPTEPCYFNWTLHRVRLPGDEGWGVLNTVWETTERRRIEMALEEANQRLREEDRRKNEFLAVLSHELRNPLTPIRNSLYVLERAVPGGEQAKRAQEVIGRQSGQLARLVDDLLDVTRISRNKIQIRRGPLELTDLVRRTVEDHHFLFEGKGITVETTFAAERLPINGDAARLAQMVGNLLQNAAKFTPVGGRVMVRTAAAASRERATLRITDNGVGIDPAMLRRLFQPFMQADATLDRSKGGLGLGLALVKGMVEMHGGAVCAHSDGPGTGAEFVVELPLDVTAAAEPSHGAARTAARRRRVLIIEDNIDAADSLREVLEFGEHEVEVAYNGPDGIGKAREFCPEVVLCDIGLPGMDGFDVARALRAEEGLKGTVLVALSGYALPEDLQRAAEAGFERHLAKPPSVEKLEQILAEVPSAHLGPGDHRGPAGGDAASGPGVDSP